MAARTLRSLRVYLQTLAQQVLYPVFVICSKQGIEGSASCALPRQTFAGKKEATRAGVVVSGSKVRGALSRAALCSSVSAGIASGARALLPTAHFPAGRDPALAKCSENRLADAGFARAALGTTRRPELFNSGQQRRRRRRRRAWPPLCSRARLATAARVAAAQPLAGRRWSSPRIARARTPWAISSTRCGTPPRTGLRGTAELHHKH